MKKGRRATQATGQVDMFEAAFTSRTAHDSIKPDKASLQSKVFDLIHNRGPYGATCDEVEHSLGMRHQTASARVRELALAGRIKVNGTRKTSSGRPARVYISVGEQDAEAGTTSSST